MKRWMTLFVILSLVCTALLAWCDDFTPYVGEPDITASVPQESELCRVLRQAGCEP